MANGNNLKKKVFFKNKKLWVGAASFVLPALALYVIFACYGVHPFGDRQIIVTDFWHQYYPFLCTLQEKLQAGESLLYAETIGLGVNFWGLIAYYCASPLNFLVAFVSKDGLRDLITVILTLKIGFSGLFFSFYLKKVFNRYDFSTVAFSSLYALCGYVLGYYWNIMWIDCVALLPLVMLGVYSIIKENKYILYIVSLAICVISNFYIGYMVCIFTAIYFFYECIRSEVKIVDFFKKLGIIALTTIVGLSLTAFMSIPAYNALGNTVSADKLNAENAVEQTMTEKVQEAAESVADGAGEFFKNSPDIIGRTLSFNEPVPKEGLPNIFSGFVCIVLLGYYLCSDKIKKREKIATSVLILVLLISLSVSDIDIIWHGMHKPNMVPYRYAFVFSFALITMAYRAFTTLPVKELGKPYNNSSKIGLLTSCAVTVFVILAGINDDVIKSVTNYMSDGTKITETMTATVLGCAAIAIIYHIIIYSLCKDKVSNQKAWSTVLCCIIVAEVIINTIIAVPTVRTTTYSTYYYHGENVEQLLEAVDASSSYSRVETSQEYILNDPALYGYKGVSTFTSTANSNVSRLMEKMGICGIPNSNRYYYETTSPLTNSILSVEHVIFKNDMKNLNPYLEEVAEVVPESGKRDVIYKNTENLPIGFMADKSFLDEEITGGNAFEKQNDLFRKLTGIEGDLFTRVPLNTVASGSNIKVTGTRDGEYTFALEDTSEDPVLSINYVTPDTNSIYAYIDCSKVSKVVVSNTTYKAVKRKYIFPVGRYPADTKLKFEYTFENSFKEKTTAKFHVYSMNDELFKQGMEILRDEPFEITNYESTLIEGVVTANDDGVFYTSIPYEKGWSMYVDGEEVEITPFENALIAAPISKGTHNITLKYSPDGFDLGVKITTGGFVVLCLLILLNIISRRKKANG